MKNSVSDMREKLRSQLENMEFYENIEFYFNSILSSCEQDIEYYSTDTVQDGYEEQQGRNWNDELLWVDTENGRHPKTEDEFEEGTKLYPYYPIRYKKVPKTEFSDWDRRKIESAKQVKEYIEKIDIFKTFKCPE